MAVNQHQPEDDATEADRTLVVEIQDGGERQGQGGRGGRNQDIQGASQGLRGEEEGGKAGRAGPAGRAAHNLACAAHYSI